MVMNNAEGCEADKLERNNLRMNDFIALALTWAETTDDLNEAVGGIKNIYDAICGNADILIIRRIEMIMFRLLVLKNYSVEERIGQSVDRGLYCRESKESAEYRAYVIKQFDQTFNRQQAAEDLKTGIAYMDEGNMETAFQYFMKSALEGFTISAYQCGKMLMDGEGCEKNEFLAAFWHWQSVNMNNENAIASLAYDYYDGRGVWLGKVRAMYWFATGAYQLNETCIQELADMLIHSEIISGEEETGQALAAAIEHLDEPEISEYVRNVGASVNAITANWLIENEGGI